jgi:hydrogenase-4 membrane subunit HyfE
MTNLYIAYVAAFFVPLLFHSWRAAVLALGVQGLLLALILATQEHDWSGPVIFEFASLFFLRAVLVPWYLFRRMNGFDTPGDFSLIAPSLLQRTLAIVLLVTAFGFGQLMSPNDAQEALQVGAAAGSILIGLLVLAHQSHPIGQIIGLFTFEGGVTLVELLSPHAMPFPVVLGVSLVFVVFVLTCGQYLTQLLSLPVAAGDVVDKEER